jgi:hypothetical protein
MFALAAKFALFAERPGTAHPGRCNYYRTVAKTFIRWLQRIGTPPGTPLVRDNYSGPSGEGRLALPISDEQFFWSDFRSKRVVHVLEPDQLGLQVAYSLLKAAHLRDDAGIRPADVAE